MVLLLLLLLLIERGYFLFCYIVFTSKCVVRTHYKVIISYYLEAIYASVVVRLQVAHMNRSDQVIIGHFLLSRLFILLLILPIVLVNLPSLLILV